MSYYKTDFVYYDPEADELHVVANDLAYVAIFLDFVWIGEL